MSQIVRVFRVIVPANLHDEFERKFSTISVHVIEDAEGALGCTIGRPTKWAPNEYVMISQWDSVESLIRFVGEKWNEAFIPKGMEHLVSSCELHHYEVFE